MRPLLSTPADDTSTKRRTDGGVARTRFATPTASVSRGPLPPFHRADGKAVVPVQQATASTPAVAAARLDGVRVSPCTNSRNPPEGGGPNIAAAFSVDRVKARTL